MQKLKRTKLQLEEENNLLKLKVELLLDMVSGDTTEKYLPSQKHPAYYNLCHSGGNRFGKNN